MYLEIVTGGPGSGKSKYIENQITNSINNGKKALIIVPERFSHIQERTMCEIFGGLGQNGIEVSTFSKLSKRILKYERFLTNAGKEMLCLKAIKQNAKDSDYVFAKVFDKPGFTSKISELIKEMKRSMVTPEDLLAFKGEKLLENKLNAIASIYKSYNDFLEDGFNDPDGDMQKLSLKLLDYDGFKDTDIYIDGFSDFLPVHYEVISSLLNTSNSVYVTLMMTMQDGQNCDGLFAPLFYSRERLEKIARDLNAKLKFKHFQGEAEYIKAQDIKYFLSTYDEFNPSLKKPVCENISISSFANRHEEIGHISAKIIEYITKENLRFKDIGIIVGDLDSYMHIIDAAFKKSGILYYADKKIPTVKHPVIRLLLAIFKVINEDFSYKSVFEYLRSGFIYKKVDDKIVCVSQDDIDTLDMYVKTRGIRGKKIWLSQDDWKAKKEGIFQDSSKQEYENPDISNIDKIRRELISPFASFIEKIKGRQKTKALADALFEFLEDINLYEGLLKEKRELERKNNYNDATKLVTVWNCLIETLDQAVVTMGDEYIKREDFIMLIQTGLSQCFVDSVPQHEDCVHINDSANSRPVRVKVLFVVGAISGELPKDNQLVGIINDNERMLLNMQGVEGLKDLKAKNEIAEFNVYNALTAPTMRMHISYPAVDDDNGINTPASLVFDLLNCFDDLTIEKQQDIHQTEKIVVSEKNDSEEEESPLSNDEFIESCEICSKYDIFELISNMLDENSENRDGLNEKIAKILFDKRFESTTSLQTYNKCPFMYFVQYGLGVKKEEEYIVRSYDIGDISHNAICEFCLMVQEGAATPEEKKQRWEELDKKKTEDFISKILDQVENMTKAENSDFGEEKISLICQRINKTIVDAVEVIRKSLVSGDFYAGEFEKEFVFEVKKDDESTFLKGKIDRIDLAKVTDDDLRVRIIDYKTGRKKFKVSDIYNKTDLQLVIYALAAKDLYKTKDSKVAAMLYNKVREEIIAEDITGNKTSKKAKLDGVIITQQEIEEVGEEELSIHDNCFKNGKQESEYLPLRTKKDKKLSKMGTSAITNKEFEYLENYVKDTVLDTKRKINKGEILPSPIDLGQGAPCSFCGYNSICLYDNNKNGMRKLINNDKKAWELIKGCEDCDE